MANPFRQGQRNRKASDPSRVPQIYRAIVGTLSVVATKLRITFGDAVTLDGIPKIGLTGGAHIGMAFPTSAIMISPTIVELDYLANVAPLDIAYAPMGDKAIRGRIGQILVVV